MLFKVVLTRTESFRVNQWGNLKIKMKFFFEKSLWLYGIRESCGAHVNVFHTMSIGGSCCLYELCVKSCNAHDLKMGWYVDVSIYE